MLKGFSRCFPSSVLLCNPYFHPSKRASLPSRIITCTAAHTLIEDWMSWRLFDDKEVVVRSVLRRLWLTRTSANGTHEARASRAGV